MTRLLLIRHANKQPGFVDTFEDEHLLRGDKETPLSEKGQLQALKLSEYLTDYDAVAVVSSDYVRACETAYYISSQYGIPHEIDTRLGERIRRISRATLMPVNFRIQQFKDMRLKCDGGESMLDVISRFSECIYEILSRYDGETVIIISHRTSITMFLSQFCTVTLNNKIELLFKGMRIFDGEWSGGPDMFDVEMDRNHTIQSITFHRYNSHQSAD